MDQEPHLSALRRPPAGEIPDMTGLPRAVYSETDSRGLAYVATRQALKTVAEMASHMSRGEFEQFQKTLLREVAELKFNADHAPVWKQAVEAAKLDGVFQYGLQRIGLHPTEKAEVPEPAPKRRRKRK